jgi:hypothetical protein
MSDNLSNPVPPRRVAVIAVHGIGQHAPGSTQNAIADLLLSLPARKYSKPRQYGPFTEVAVQMPLQPVDTVASGCGPKIPAVASKNWLKKLGSAFEEKSEVFAINRRKGKDAGAKTSKPKDEAGENNQAEETPKMSVEVGDTGQQYTCTLIKDYCGGADSDSDANVFRTKRLEGMRLTDAKGEPDCTKVDVYEVLWADLAKPYNGFVTFFVALFQLLLHLGSLSRLALDTGSHECDGNVWRACRWSQRWAVRVLQMFLPFSQVVLAIAIVSCFGNAYSLTTGQPWFATAMGAIGGIVAMLIASLKFQTQMRMRPWRWVLYRLTPGVLGAGLALGAVELLKRLAMAAGLKCPEATARASDVAGEVLCWLVVGAGLLYFVLNNYEDIRKGAMLAGWTLYFFAFGIFLLCICRSHAHVMIATYWTCKFLLVQVRVFWAAMAVLGVTASSLGAIGCWRMPAGEQRARARAAVRTSRFALALPSVLFLVVTLLLWGGMYRAVAWIHNHQPFLTWRQASTPIFDHAPGSFSAHAAHLLANYSITPGVAWMRNVPHDSPGVSYPQTFDVFVNNVLGWSVGYQLPVTLGLLALALFLLVTWVLPGVITERFPDRFLLNGKQIAPRDVSNAATLRMGQWLSRGLDSTATVTWILWCAIFVAPLTYAALYLTVSVDAHFGWHLRGCMTGALEWLRANTLYLTSATLALGATVLAAAAKGGQNVLSTVLDVDTYLRTSPGNGTPRAKIFERYMSTLRYVAAFGKEGPCGREQVQDTPYTEVVIAAHSLGALISGDLLHFLPSEYCAEKKIVGTGTQLPLRLFTFGNPTRQLLTRFFPYLYDWVRPYPDNGMGPLPSTAARQMPGPLPSEPVAPPNADGAPGVIHGCNPSNLPDPADLGLQCWVSAYRSGDYVGRSLWLDEWYQRPEFNPTAQPHPLVAKSADGTRWEMCIGAGAHTHYMDDTAPDMAWMLDRLI